MNPKRINSLFLRPGILIPLVIAAVFALTAGSCCDTKVNSAIVIGDQPPMVDRVTSQLVVICPGEAVTVGWKVSGDVNSVDLTDAGSVEHPTGMRTFKPETDAEYTVTGKGECTRKSTSKAIVVEDGTEITIAADKKTDFSGNFYYEAHLLEQFYSPSIKVTSVRLSAPTTVAGWQVRKIDKDGTIRNFPIKNAYTSPWTNPIPLIETWQLLPLNLSEIDARNIPLSVEMMVTLKCG